ncbi:DNA recombination protein RmuC [Thermodesulfatator atlanticus]
MIEIAFLSGGFAVGFLLAWFLRTRETRFLESRVKELQEEKEALKQTLSQDLIKTLEAFSGKITSQNAKILADLSREIFEAREKHLEKITLPLNEHLKELKAELRELEAKREHAYGKLAEKLESLVSEHLPRLEKEANLLKSIFQSPQLRGHWGEIQLKRLVELAGLLEHCDFSTQVTTQTKYRPDLVVHLPQGKVIAVDAKVPVLKQGQKLARLLRDHVKSLAQKAYWEALQKELKRSPEFVVLFLPAESLLAQAYQEDPEILEFAAEKKIILATPLTLLSMLKAVAFAWQEESFVKNAEEIIQLGRELFSRLETFAEHISRLGASVEKVVTTYNQLVGSYQRRLYPLARRFQELKAVSNDKEATLPQELDLKKLDR